MTVEQLAREVHDFMRTWEIASRLGEPEQCALAMAKGKVLWLRSQEVLRGSGEFMGRQPPYMSDHSN